MSKKVCLIIEIEDMAYDVMYGGRTGDVKIGYMKTMTKSDTIPCFDANLTIDSGKFFHADALSIMLCAEKQKTERAGQLLLGYAEHPENHPDLFTTKE